MWYRNFSKLLMPNSSSKVRLLLWHCREHFSCLRRKLAENELVCFRLAKRLLSTPSVLDEKSSGTEKSSSRKLTENLLDNAVSYADETPTNPQDVWSSGPYPVRSASKESEPADVDEESDPRNKCVVMFPGQGSQRKGMGRLLLRHSSVAEMYSTASEILNYDLLKLCLNGPQEKLNETRYCQPALLVTSLAAVQKLRDTNPEAVENCIATMGFSVGEIASLVFAGALTFESAVHLVRVRGEAMQAASDLVPSGMMTVFLSPAARLELALETAREWAEKKGVKDPVCSLANYLYPACKVIAGHQEALEFIEVNCKAFGIKNTKCIAVSGAFHTSLMKPALPAWKLALSQVTFSEPLMPVYSNVTGKPYTLKSMTQTLEKHLTSPVKWEQCLSNAYDSPKDTRFPTSYECGPGESLKAILKRVNMKSWKYTYNIDT